MADPRQPSFWDDENRRFLARFQELLLRIYTAGAEQAAGELGSLELLIDWDAWNTQAVAYLRRYGLELARGINGTTRRQVIGAIEEWIRAGEPLTLLQERLTPVFGRRRAEVIASTEVTRAYAEGNMALWQSTGFVSGKQWRTAVDERVCPICGPLHGQVVAFDNPFALDVGTLAGTSQLRRLVGSEDTQRLQRRAASLLRNNGGGQYTAPPAHPRCRCWLQPVVSEIDVRQQRLADLGLLQALADREIIVFGEVAHA